jgi:hypothetical protein
MELPSVQNYWSRVNLDIINKVRLNSEMPKTIGAMLRFIVLGSSPLRPSILLDCLVIMYGVNFVNNIILKHPAAPINDLIYIHTHRTQSLMQLHKSFVKSPFSSPR